jgi:TatD DNase family protein
MILFDSHCHLNDPAYAKDMVATVKRAAEAGVISVMVVGIDEATSGQAVAIARANKTYAASVGVHPHDAKSCSEKTLAALVDLAKDPTVRAWGETGLDFNRMFSPKEIQEKWFVRQLEMADELNLPLIFHERDSEGRFIEILSDRYKTAGRAGVVHCFSGTRHDLDACLNLGLHIGITGIITIASRGKNLRDMVKKIPADRLLVETDAPYLTPAPERNQHRRNEPAFVRSVLLKLAEVRGEDPKTLAEQIWRNTCRLFRMDIKETAS